MAETGTSTNWFGDILDTFKPTVQNLAKGYSNQLMYGKEYATRSAMVDELADFSALNGSGANDTDASRKYALRDVIDLMTGKRQNEAAVAGTNSTTWVIIGGAALLLVLVLLIRR